ncbi:MAG TPA: hypothetical protein VFQ51_04525, partial [Vicinamibacteria bacterium]|nr:hypothetical protein [Vicinamibacteria bacterium]
MSRRNPSPPGRIPLALALFLGAAAPALAVPALPNEPDASPLWQDVDETALMAPDHYRVLTPGTYRTLRLDEVAFASLVEKAPRELTDDARGRKVVLSLPLPEGGFARFRIEDSPIMEEALAAEFPDLRTFRGQGIDDPSATLRFDWTPNGLHAMVLRAGSTLFVDPRTQGDTTHYVAYYKKDYERRVKPDFRCGVSGERIAPSPQVGPGTEAPGSTLQVY